MGMIGNSPSLGSVVPEQLQLGSLVANAVAFLDANKQFKSTSALTFNGTTLTANALTVSNATTLSAGTANGVAYLNGSKVLTTGSALTFDGTNLGVGTATPTAITGTARVVDVVGTTYGFGLFGNGTVTAQIAGDGANGLSLIGSRSNHPVSFILNNTEQMRLTSTGLGIGTSSPGSKLEISGSGPITRITDTGTVGGIFRVTTNSGGAGSRFGIESSTGGTWASGSAAYATIVTSEGGYPIQFAPTGTVRATLDTSGNLGLGVTPSAWGTSWKAFEFSGGNAVYSNGGQMSLSSNAYQDSVGWKYKGNGAAGLYANVVGAHLWFNAPSGTAGNAISFTQAMTLDASGNLALGGASSFLKFSSSMYVGVGSGLSGAYTTNDMAVWNGGTGNLVLVNNGSERARIASGGNFSIGTTSALGRLTVDQGADNNGIALAYSGRGSSRVEWELSGISNENCSWVHNNGTNRYTLQTIGRDNIIWLTNNTERARIDSSGNLLVGTTGQIVGGGGVGVHIQAGSYPLVMRNPGAASGRFWRNEIDTNNTLYIANATSNGVYMTNGATSWTALSDERHKDIIEPITNAAEKVSSLRAVIGRYKSDDEGIRRSFLIAQDVQAVLPEAVDATNPDRLGVSYTDTIPLLVAAIQEQQAIINAQSAALEQLKAQLTSVSADVAALKAAA